MNQQASAFSPLPLANDEVHLWLAFDRQINDENLLSAYWQLLNEEERAQQQRFYFAKDRHQYLVTRALVRTVLSRYAPVAPAAWQFAKNRYGRPEIANPAASGLGLSFNVSHTAGLILLGVARQRIVGVDTENIVEREAPLELAPRYFSAQETADLYALPIEAQSERFFYYWTLKESYIKARGMGLSIPLDQFGFSFPDSAGIQLALDARINDAPSNWEFLLLKPDDSHLVAVCVEPSTGKTALIVRNVVPMDGDCCIDIPLLRRSASIS